MSKPEIEAQLRENLARVRNLVEIYAKRTTTPGKGRRPVGSTDVLRAAVVLLHATLEDLVRTVLRDLLPKRGEVVLDKVPLAGVSEYGKPEKFLLGKLVHFRGKTVDQVLSESVDKFLARSNYSKPGDIASAITDAGLDKKPVEPFFGDLKELMDRRHWIVNRADRNDKSGSGHHQAKSIGTEHVSRWVMSVENFAKEILGQLPGAGA